MKTLRTALLLASTALASTAFGQGTPIGFEETFALAADRAAALEELIPGTPEYYFYATLHAQNEGRLNEAEELLNTWRKRHGRGRPLDDMQLRQALLGYGEDSGRTFEFLVRNLGLRFNHRAERTGASPNLPTALDQDLIAYAALFERALRRGDRAVEEFENRALAHLATRDLTDRQLADLLARLERPDVRGLPALIVRNLADPRHRGFGSLPIHGRLLLEQLDECARLRPELLEDTAFVSAYLTRLAPGADADFEDPAVRIAYLERLERFAARLSPAFNSLLAHVLHHRLALDLSLGEPDRERFLRYLRIPRQTNYGDPAFLRQKKTADLSRGWSTGFAAVHDDQPLVRAYLEHFLAGGVAPTEFVGPLHRRYVDRIHAETMILAGEGDMERWFSLLDDAAYYERLKDRVELRFPPHQSRDFEGEGPVRIELDVKNVDTLLVKVFEIDTLGFLEAQGGRMRDVDASIDLDGLVASRELTFEYDSPPARRVRRSFSFDDLEGPGVWVIDFIGGGLSSRAVVRRGSLSYLERRGSAGHVFQVLDGANQVQDQASILYAGRRFDADEKGRITIPYSTEPGRRQMLLLLDDFAVLDEFDHAGESYRLEAAVHVERESLLTGETALISVRPRLSVSGTPTSLALLEDVTLEIRSVDLDNVSTTQTVRDFELFADREAWHTVKVPPRTIALSVRLHATVENLSTGARDTLESEMHSFPINLIDKSSELASALLTRTPQGYAVEVRGKNGEPIVDRVLRVELKHRDFKRTVRVELKTDARGRILLGALEDIVHVRATGVTLDARWRLEEPLRSGAPESAGALCGLTDQVLRLPYEGGAAELSRASATLLEVRSGVPVRDRFAHLSSNDGFLELRGLPAGDYELALHESGERYSVSITDGTARSGWGLGKARRLELSDPDPLLIASAGIEGDALSVQLTNAGPNTRVHVTVTRYVSPFDAHESLALPALRGLRLGNVARSPSLLASERSISEEYRYILERRLARTFPGNMLDRPGLLLNPWAIDESTDTILGVGGGAGGRFGGRSGGSTRSQAAPASGAADDGRLDPGTLANLDFLPASARLLVNLRPDENGTVRIATEELGLYPILRIVAVDGGVTLSKTVIREEVELEPRDRRLWAGLDPALHLTEQRRIEYFAPGEAAALGDLAHAGVRVVDSLASVFQLFRTLSGDAGLDDFRFLVSWPEHSPEEKRELYSKYACHELHVFLREKDPTFFHEVVRPYLVHKEAKTFIDHWLLGNDLSRYFEPWAFARLNVVERILLLRGAEGGAARHVEELVDLLPPDTYDPALYFESLLASGALDADDRLRAVLGQRMEEARGKKRYRGPGDTTPPSGRGASSESPSGPASPGPADKESNKTAGKDGFFLGRKVADSLSDAPAEVFEELAALGYSGDFSEMDADREARQAARGFFQNVADTQELAEAHYWRVPRPSMTAELITPTPFWHDFAALEAEAPFVSTRFPLATRNLAEMLLALAFLDLPFEAGEHRIEDTDGKTRIIPASGLFLAHKEIAEAKSGESAPPVLVGQDFLRQDDPFILDRGQRRDRFVTDEFLARVAYLGRVVVTNPGSAPLDVDVLLQIPEGALPVQRGFETRGVPVTLGAYASRSIEYAFYFPEPGAYRHYPVHVGSDGALLGFAPARTFTVVDQPSKVDTTSWAHVSQRADTEVLVDYLAQANLHALDLSRIAWRMADRAVFTRITNLLRDRFCYDATLWSYGLEHADERTAREYLERRDDVAKRCGPVLASELLTLEPVERSWHEHLEYDPLINGRAHRFGEDREILDRDFAQQYLSFLRTLAYRPSLDSARRLEVTYYLALQDRISDALDTFAGVRPEEVVTRLQYDYMRAYLDFYTGELDDARRIAASYADHPVTRWRARFENVLAQLDEAEGRGTGPADLDGDGGQDGLAASEPTLELVVEAGRVVLTTDGLSECTVGYREMDIELLFSTSPFLQADAGSFASVKPNRVDELSQLPGGSFDYELPAEFRNSNVLIEARAGGLVRRQAYYANDLTVQAIENYGQIRVSQAESGKLLPGAYVKVYAQLASGETRFHKDGYTDIRGRFDYVSLSGMDGAQITRFAVLILSPENGAVVRELAPPAK